MRKLIYVTLLSIGCFMTLAMLWEKTPPKTPLQYNLTKPWHKYELPQTLNEVSGIKFIKARTLACIQDEKGIVYFYKLSSKRITQELKFEKKGDYEDLCLVEDDLYILRSDGNLFRIKNYQSSDFKVKKYETRLSEKNDTEGLCYDEKNDRLLILCKEKAGVKKKLKDQKAIYAFQLADKKVKKKPVFTIETEAVADLLDKKHSKVDYKPAGLAIHPNDGTLYIIDSVEKTLTILSTAGELISVHHLNIPQLPQPEGIAFDKRGNLYIASEASESSHAFIYSFKQQ